MKIPGTPQRQLAKRYQGHVVLANHKTHTVVKAWPKKRPGVLHPTTQAQVQLWDLATSLVPFTAGPMREFAQITSLNTAFYARDILLSAMYGNYVSWPGFGIMPAGPTAPKVVIRVKGGKPPKRVPPHPPRQINNVRQITSQTRTDTSFTSELIFGLPAHHPKIWMTCITPQMVMTTKNEQGQDVPHGRKQWISHICGVFDPVSGSGNTWHWDFEPCCSCADDCYWFVGELDTPGTSIMWTSVALPCPECPQPQVAAFQSGFGTTAYASFPPYELFDQSAYTILEAPLTQAGPFILCPAGGTLSGEAEMAFFGSPGCVGAAVCIDNVGNIIGVGAPSSGPGTPGWVVELSFADVPLAPSATGFAFGLIELVPSIAPPFVQEISEATWQGP